ncbi:MAG: YcxB family protein [Clostridia bacterium]|nr:YcxB family protein [Clostridia bacterium]
MKKLLFALVLTLTLTTLFTVSFALAEEISTEDFVMMSGEVLGYMPEYVEDDDMIHLFVKGAQMYSVEKRAFGDEAIKALEKFRYELAFDGFVFVPEEGLKIEGNLVWFDATETPRILVEVYEIELSDREFFLRDGCDVFVRTHAINQLLYEMELEKFRYAAMLLSE